MKKWLISFLLLISIFIGYNKVGATVFDYDGSLNTQTNIDNLNDVVNYIKSNDSRDFVIINDYINSTLGRQYYVVFFKPNTDTDNTFYLRSYITDASTSNYRIKYFGYGVYSSDSNSTDIGLDSSLLTTRSPFASEYCYLSPNASTSNLDSFKSCLSSKYFNNNTYNNSSYLFISNYNSSEDVSSNPHLLYSSFDLKIGMTNLGYNDLSVNYNGNNYTYDVGDVFQPFLNFVNDGYNGIVVNLVKDLGNNTFGFFQNVVGINATSLSGVADTLSIICEENKPFENGYCSMNYNDLINHNSNINVFNNYATEFTQLFGNNTGYLYNDKYYLYSFRIQKPFVPQVGNIFINSLTNNSNQVNILGVYLNDGGSYTDYVVKFKIQNSNYDSSTNLKDILVVFRDGLGTYYNNFIPNTFNYSVYRSFKLQYFDSEPTISNVNDFYNNNDLTYIDGVSSQTSFFTDNEFNSFGFGGIITAPFRFLYALENYESCSDITLPFPHSNQNLTLTCVRKTIPDSLNPLIVILQVVLSGIISYRIAVGTLKIIKDVSSPEDSNIEVVDL